MMQYRPLGKTGFQVSEIGFGAWGIGGDMWQGAEDRESLRALHRAADLGVNFVDTALAYGDSHSESLVGQFVRERKERIIVATKIPPKNRQWPARPGVPFQEAFPRDYIIACTERSLRNLRVDAIDLQQFHVWRDDWMSADEIWEAVDRLKAAGKIRHIGISINDHDPESALITAEKKGVASFQVIYNIFDQSPADRLFPLCQRLGIGIIARVPFDEGGLTGRITPDTTFPEGDWRNRYFQGDRKKQVSNRVGKLKELLGTEARTLPELALRFCLSHPAVSTVIPGMRTVEHVETNAAVSDGKRLSETLVGKLQHHRWMRNFYGS